MSRLRLTACLAALGLAAGVAIADEPPPERSTSDLEEARSRYELGIKHYNLGEFGAAIAEFKAAYELSGEPDLLFNIAQAYRLKEDYKEALFFYDSYLRLRPDAANRADVESRIAATRKLLEEQKQLQESLPQGVIPPADGTAEPPPPELGAPAPALPPASRRSTRIASLVCAGTGVALAGGSAYFAMRAKDGWDEINSLAVDRGAWSPHHAEVEADASRSERIAIGFALAGGVGLAAAGVLGYLGWREEDRAATLAIGAGADRAEVTVTWGF